MLGLLLGARFGLHFPLCSGWGSASGSWNQSRRRLLGCDPGAGPCEARCDSCARSIPRSYRAGLHPGSPGAFPPADRARRILARRRTGKRLGPPPPPPGRSTRAGSLFRLCTWSWEFSACSVCREDAS